MKTIDLVYEKLINKWGVDNKGKGTIHCVKPMEYSKLILAVINKMLIKNKDLKVFICVDSYNTRKNIIETLQNNDIDVSRITILSEKYINARFRYVYDLAIFVGIKSYSLYVNCISTSSTFNLFIITDDIIKAEDLTNIYKHFPVINDKLDSSKINAINITSPVEETRVGCIFNVEDKESYDKYTEFVTGCFNIFGDFENIEKCRIGDSKLCISATEFRNNIAISNGWSAELDMTSPFNRQIDECYNPNILLDKANSCYEIIRKRSNLCSDNKEKLESIYNIVKDNPDKKILIISKRGEFAATITNYLNDKDIACGDYHDKIEPKLLVDENGFPVLYKSGTKKGEPRIIKSTAISSSNMALFNNDQLRVLSIKNSSSDELKITCDIWIITSPLCEEVNTLKYRFNKVVFNGTPNIIYKIYMQGSIEEKQLLNAKINEFTTVISKTVNDEIFY